MGEHHTRNIKHLSINKASHLLIKDALKSVENLETYDLIEMN